MSTFIGNTQPNNYYIGNTPLSALYVGTNKIWPVGQEIAYFDFGNIASFPSSASTVVNNISANKNYIAGNISFYQLNRWPDNGTVISGRQDPSGSGTFMPFTSSVVNTSMYGAPAGTLFAITSSAFTFETWIRPYNKKADGNPYLVGPGHNEIIGIYQDFDFGINNESVNDRRMVVMAKSLVTSLPISASTATNVVDVAQWNHLVYTLFRNSSGIVTFTMYKNGVFQPIVQNNITASNVFPQRLPGGGGGSQLLAVNNINQFLGNRFGLFDLSMMRMYNKVLDASEVLSLFEATRARYSI
jgi:hypothetical protein